MENRIIQYHAKDKNLMAALAELANLMREQAAKNKDNQFWSDLSVYCDGLVPYTPAPEERITRRFD